MRVPRAGVWVGGVAFVVAAVGVLLGGGAGVGTAAALPVDREADLAVHGDVSVREGVVRVRFVPQNHGPADLADATVHVRWSVPVAEVRALPGACQQAGTGAVLCRTGALGAGAKGEPVEMVVRAVGEPDAVSVRIGTEWDGGVADLNPRNNEHAVLALDTGDTYYF
ncbi:hypothetical protein AB0H82_25565 [Streptomyces sp. NPDC050732]|uniref:hypothetical protein n=1 Tax=Streptomyces sp. NPDC050732 TaxID=3154632 RepID=UPI003429863A